MKEIMPALQFLTGKRVKWQLFVSYDAIIKWPLCRLWSRNGLLLQNAPFTYAHGSFSHSHLRAVSSQSSHILLVLVFQSPSVLKPIWSFFQSSYVRGKCADLTVYLRIMFGDCSRCIRFHFGSDSAGNMRRLVADELPTTKRWRYECPIRGDFFKRFKKIACTEEWTGDCTGMLANARGHSPHTRRWSRECFIRQLGWGL